MWTATQATLASQSSPLMRWSALGLAYLFAAILPLFYFALWRDAGTPGVSGSLRLLCGAGALMGVIVVAEGLPVTTVKTALSDLATLSCVALLIALLRSRQSMAPKSKLLRRMTWIAVLGGALWFGINLLALLRPAKGAVLTLLEQVCLFTVPLLTHLSPDAGNSLH